ncbi:response regulator [Desulfobacter latus]|uniref:Response regulator n=1 Tax=Desulfobacter latus TaxID=2292 RepID=A0A850TGY1_9BACT|nr:response regulator [Desulfobacter latus]NWH06816.1 response regulator [Desulfobacter latus]
MEETKKSILIIDDEDYIRQSFIDYFEDRHWLVFDTKSGESALELLKNQACSAAIVDIRMTGMDGETFIKNASKKYPVMGFVICTGSPEYQTSEDILQLPNVANQIFGKPVIDIDKLENTIKGML